MEKVDEDRRKTIENLLHITKAHDFGMCSFNTNGVEITMNNTNATLIPASNSNPNLTLTQNVTLVLTQAVLIDMLFMLYVGVVHFFALYNCPARPTGLL